jgi:type IV pilus assembly protein PilA
VTTVYCRKCGKSISDVTAICPHCGAQQRTSGEMTAAAALELQRWSGFWRRVAAQIIDGLAIFIPLLIIVGGLLYVVLSRRAGTAAQWFAVYGGELLVYGLYQATLNSSEASATWGRRAVGIAVVDAETGAPLEFGRAFWRSAVSFFSGIIVLPQLLQLVTQKRQSLADLLSGAVVVQRNPAGAGAVVVAIVAIPVCVFFFGIFAAIAIPAYQDYTVRARVTEGLALANSVKPIVAQNAVTGTADLSEQVPKSFTSRNVDSVVVDRNGVITLTMNPSAKSVQFSLTPYEANFPLVAGHNVSDAITWRCAVSDARNDRYVPTECRV